MTIILEVYFVLCIALLVFDIVFLAMKNHKIDAFMPRNTTFEKKLREEILLRRETGAFSAHFTAELPSLLGQTKNLISLHAEMERDTEVTNWFQGYVYEQVDTYANKRDYEQAYYAYVISTLDFAEHTLPADFAGKFLAFLDSKSLYVFCNTMDALYQCGEVHLLLTALNKVNERSRFYHKKLLVDGLLGAKTDRAQLYDAIIEQFDSYEPYLQDCLLDVFRMSNYDVSALCQKILQSKDAEEQVRYSAMRYFVKHTSAFSREYFLSCLADEEAPWVKQMIAIQGLSEYDDSEVHQAIVGKFTSPHWHVRSYVTDYLYRHNLSREEMTELLKLQDKYADDALLYRYREDREMTEFIMKTMQTFAEEREKQIQEPLPDEQLLSV